MNTPKIIFFGNSKYSVLGAKIIHKYYPLDLVVTTPDKPQGRKQILTSSPVKLWANSCKIPVLEIDTIDQSVIDQIKQREPDFFIVEDYGLIMPAELLSIPKYASLNVHHSLLPKYRGSSPAPAAILNGDKMTGVTIIEMTEKMDAGDVVASDSYVLASDETTETLLIELNTLGASLIPQVIKGYLDGTVTKTKQDSSLATYTWKKAETKQKAFFDITNPPSLTELDRMIRAFYPWPNAWTNWNGKIIKFYPERKIQLEGKSPVSFEEFVRGYPTFPLKQLLLD